MTVWLRCVKCWDDPTRLRDHCVGIQSEILTLELNIRKIFLTHKVTGSLVVKAPSQNTGCPGFNSQPVHSLDYHSRSILEKEFISAYKLFFLSSCLFTAPGPSIQQGYMTHLTSHWPILIVLDKFSRTNLAMIHYEYRPRNACKTLTCSSVHDYLC